MNIVAAIGQCPYSGTSPTKLNLATVKVIGLAVLDMIKQALGLAPVYIPAAAQPGQVGALTAPGSVEGLLSIVKDSGYGKLSPFATACMRKADGRHPSTDYLNQVNTQCV